MDSRLPGFFRMTREDRIRTVSDALGVDPSIVADALACGGLSLDDADRLVEDVVGTFALPFSVAPNFRIDDRDVYVPMVTEEPSVVAAAAHAALLVREGGGFVTECDPPVMIGQVQVFADDLAAARTRILAEQDVLLALAAEADPGLARAGGGPIGLEVKTIEAPDPAESFLVVHLLVDVRDAMGANAVNSMAERIAPDLAAVAGGQTGLRILTNLCDRRRVRVRCRVPRAALQAAGFDPAEVRDGIVAASRFAELDPYRAVTANKGVMNGTDAVVLATGNDWRAVEAGAHAWAARDGRYRPLATWGLDGDDLSGRLEMPLAVGIVGGSTRVHPAARLAIRLSGARTASDLAAVAACAGLANSLAALRALATDGIQAGHMRLHARHDGRT